MPLFGALPERELSPLVEQAKGIEFDAGQTIFTQDAESDAIFKLQSGAARLYRLLPDGRRHVVGFALPGDFLGISMAEQRSFNAEALTNLRALRFDRAAFGKFVGSRPELLRAMYDLAARELTDAHSRMLSLGRKTAEERVASFLLDFSRRRPKTANGFVALPMTRLDIADHLGLTLETVSRIIHSMVRRKALAIAPGGVRILDPALLGKLAEPD